MIGSRSRDDAKIGGITPEELSFRGRCDASPWNMPELRAYYGYPVALAFMTVVVVALLVAFRRRKWL